MKLKRNLSRDFNNSSNSIYRDSIEIENNNKRNSDLVKSVDKLSRKSTKEIIEPKFVNYGSNNGDAKINRKSSIIVPNVSVKEN